MTPLHILDVKNILGEGILWDARTQSAVWTDIQSSTFWQWQPGSDPASSALPQRLGSFALTTTPGTYLGGFEQGFAHFTPSTGAFELLAPVTADHSHLRLNDGRVDRNGIFWAGSMAETTGTPLQAGTVASSKNSACAISILWLVGLIPCVRSRAAISVDVCVLLRSIRVIES